jgi:BASS family bile acid:Na+ symporter
MRWTLFLSLVLKELPSRTVAFHQIGINLQINVHRPPLSIRKRCTTTTTTEKLRESVHNSKLKAPYDYRSCTTEVFSTTISTTDDHVPESKPLAIYTPLMTSLAAVSGMTMPSLVSRTLGSITVMQTCLATLMLAMGLTITPKDLSKAFQKPSILVINAFFCFGLMPAIAYFIATALSFHPDLMAGIVLLGSVSGGQASNLFTLLAGGDVALSIICTLSTTLLGVIATPLLIKFLLGHAVAVNGVAVLQSVASLVLAPLLTGKFFILRVHVLVWRQETHKYPQKRSFILNTSRLVHLTLSQYYILGLAIGRLKPQLARKIAPSCPSVAIIATLILVAGGAANSVSSFEMNCVTAIASSCLLPLIGGGLALLFTTHFTSIAETSKRALVVETLSKSPTLAYVLARKHFGIKACAIPAAAMVSLAVIGALVASAWSVLDGVVKD